MTNAPTAPPAPHHWQRLRLKRLVVLRAGEAIEGTAIRETGEFPVYGGNGQRGYTDRFTHEGDRILLGRQGALCGNVNYALGKFWATEHAIVATPRRKFNTIWLGETLRAMNLNQYSQSAAQPGIAVDVIANLEVMVPPLDEQNRIAQHLTIRTAEMDRLLQAKRRLLRLLAEKRRALITHAVTRGLDADALYCDSGIPWLGEIPAHYAIKRLKLLAEVRGGLTLGKNYGNLPKSEYPYLRVANVQDAHLNLEEVSTVSVPEAEAESCLLQAGDVLMNEGGDLDKLGRGCVWLGEIDPCLHQNHVFAVRPHGVSSDWLAAWTSTDTAKRYFELRAKRSTNLASISGTSIGELPVILPPLEEQRAILNYVHDNERKLSKLRDSAERTIALLQERRAALISAAVTGQLDISNPSALELAA